ncbi:MAG: glutaminyl-peptide cyclotransferase [Acidobacteria bacterium]|nr:glutaminyl-peptide cyclotransferase [Acidobacteriota bacterium]
MARTPGTTQPDRRIGRRTFLALAGTAVLAVTVLVFALRPAGTSSPAAANGAASTPAPAPARYSFTVSNTYPHDPEAFTQGLLYRDGHLFESTGLNGRSSLRKVRLETGEVVQRRDVDRQYFAEGLVDWGNRLIQLTWQSNLGFVYALDSFEPLRTFAYEGEGWGLTRDARRLVMSDGSSTLRFIDPETLTETGRLEVTERGFPVTYLNELEMIRGEIFANIWQTDEVVVIAPDTGYVKARIDFSPLRARLDSTRPVDVFNGIAWDEARDRLFVTGKLWPKLFDVRINRD